MKKKKKLFYDIFYALQNAFLETFKFVIFVYLISMRES